MEGGVDGSKAANVENFKKAAEVGPLAGINPETAAIDVSVKLGVGAPYKVIEGVADINTLDEVTIQHKAGQVFLIDFWATWCPPCQKPMAHN